MASLITHPLVPLALGAALGPHVIGRRLLIVASLATIVADADVIAFSFGIPYSSPFGHRGFTHSVAFALLLAAAAAHWAPRFERPPVTVFGFLLVAALSHPLLDAMTNGGLGVAFAWPFSDARMFAPWRPLAVSPIGIRAFLGEWGVHVLRTEVRWIWAPLACVAVCGWGLRRWRSTRP